MLRYGIYGGFILNPLDFMEVIGWGFLSILLRHFIEGLIAAQFQMMGVDYTLPDLFKPLAMGNRHDGQKSPGIVNHMVLPNTGPSTGPSSEGQQSLPSKGQQSLPPIRKLFPEFLGPQSSLSENVKGKYVATGDKASELTKLTPTELTPTEKLALAEQARIFTKEHPGYAVSSIKKRFGFDALSKEQKEAWRAQCRKS